MYGDFPIDRGQLALNSTSTPKVFTSPCRHLLLRSNATSAGKRRLGQLLGAWYEFSRLFQICCFYFLKQKPSSAIVIQPMENHNATVGVFMMRLPVAHDGFAPIGQIGLCCATALGTRGDPLPQSHSSHVAGKTVVKRSSMVKSCCL